MGAKSSAHSDSPSLEATSAAARRGRADEQELVRVQRDIRENVVIVGGGVQARASGDTRVVVGQCEKTEFGRGCKYQSGHRCRKEQLVAKESTLRAGERKRRETGRSPHARRVRMRACLSLLSMLRVDARLLSGRVLHAFSI
eukprot:725527-Pleurochrysis_carterae.AAC.1